MGMSTAMGRGWLSNSSGNPITPKTTRTEADDPEQHQHPSTNQAVARTRTHGLDAFGCLSGRRMFVTTLAEFEKGHGCSA